jgi:hypothetical protein
MLKAWVRRNCRQLVSVCRTGAGGMRWRVKIRRIVDAPTRWPSLSNSPGRTQRHRLARGGNRQLNAALHRIAITQVRITDSPGQLYYQRRRARGDTAMEALRALKRRLARVVFNLLQADTTVAINDLSTAA